MQTMNPRRAIGLTVSILLVAASAPLAAQEREVRDLSGFTAISAGGGIDLVIRQGDEFVVEVLASGGNASDIVTEVDDGTLEIRRAGFGFNITSWFGSHAVHVTLPRLEAVSASGGSDVTGDGPITADRLRISASGGSDVDLELMADELEIAASGGSDVDLAGTARSLRVETSGGSDLSGRNFEAREAELRSSGGSDISITVLDRIVARASGGSDIVYRGNPQAVDVDAGHGADIVHR